MKMQIISSTQSVIPAKAGIRLFAHQISAFAGMTQKKKPLFYLLIALSLGVISFTTPQAMPLPAKKPLRAAAEKKTEAVPLPKPTQSGGLAEGAPLPVEDVDESYTLPDYPDGTMVGYGAPEIYAAGEEDTLLDIARHFGLGFVEIRAANPEVDPWTPVPGERVIIPAFNLLPRAPQTGIVVNLAQMRLYYFKEAGKAPITFPIGIGREGLQTPTGETTVVRKAAGPSWHPTDRMREEKPWLPASIPPGPSNPLGTHALYLGWPTFLIHGSNKPWAIGRRVSSGCMRMYPEDIRELFDMVPPGTKVTVVDQPILIGWINDDLFLEANPSKTQSNEIEIEGKATPKPITDALKKMITDTAGVAAGKIDWQTVHEALQERRGYPVVIASLKAPRPQKNPPAVKSEKPAAKKQEKTKPVAKKETAQPQTFNR